MPIINIDGPKLSKDQKAQLIKEFTSVASKVIELPEEAFIVLIKESDRDNVGVGGVMLSEKQK